LIRKQRRKAPILEWVPESAFSQAPPNPDAAAPPPERPHERVSRILQQWLHDRPSTERVRLLVTLREDLPELRLPALKPRVAPEAIENIGFRRQRWTILDERTAERHRHHDAFLTRTCPGGILLESFPFANVMHVELPLGAVDALLRDEAVQYVQPAVGNEPPPQQSRTIADGRQYIQSDFWMYWFGVSGNRNASWERIGLLDTGVRASHILLSGRIISAKDCVRTYANQCTLPFDGMTPDPSDNLNHGTASANIISGNLTGFGDAYKGVTLYGINSYKVYNDTTGGLDSAAVLRALTVSGGDNDHIVVAEMQAVETQDGAIATTASNLATTGGQTVVGAMGNGPLPGVNDYLPRSPAVGRMVLGIGAVDFASGQVIAPQSNGPTPDGRIKPDVLLPANVYTASNASDVALRSDTFNDTSCATAFAGAVAAIYYNLPLDSPWTQYLFWHLEYPGLIYAHAIADGRNQFIPDNTQGAGGVRLAGSWCEVGDQYPVSDDGYTIGEVTLDATHSLVDVPFWVHVGPDDPDCPLYDNRIDASIWSEDTPSYPHQDFRLFVLTPQGSLLSTSQLAGSVFQKAIAFGDFRDTQNQYICRILSYPGAPTHPIRVHVFTNTSHR
jgi:hypothetical protein